MIKIRFILVFICFFLIASCINETDERLLSHHQKNNGESINIYYVGVGATANEVIQVRKSNKGKNEILIKAFDDYNYLESSRMLNDTCLQLIINDTGYFKHKPDTLMLNIK